MRAIIKKPGKAPQKINVDNTLKALQTAIGGYIESVNMVSGSNFTMLVDEDGRLKGLKPNWCGLVGPILVVGVKGEEFCDLPKDVEMTMMRMMRVEDTKKEP